MVTLPAPLTSARQSDPSDRSPVVSMSGRAAITWPCCLDDEPRPSPGLSFLRDGPGAVGRNQADTPVRQCLDGTRPCSPFEGPCRSVAAELDYRRVSGSA